jgi:demethylmenaquinone methyltransferase/2-methoxy-6-polyprenyl-1,4-benzoquinol methylase
VLGGSAAKMMNMYEQEKITPYHNGEKASQVEQMFDNIAPTYDKLNHRLSWDIDKGWRKKAIKALAPYQPQSLLDIATGTGDFAILATQILHPERVVGADISEGMMQIGREKVKALGLEDVVTFEKEDCTHLSYNNDTFDAVTAAFGIRNFADLDAGLREMCRVLRPGGHLSIVELTTPVKFPMRQLFHIYSHTVLPVYGRLISKDTSAYSYLTKTIEAFPQGERMVGILKKAGFAEASFKRLTFGICTMYFATK